MSFRVLGWYGASTDPTSHRTFYSVLPFNATSPTTIRKGQIHMIGDYPASERSVTRPARRRADSRNTTRDAVEQIKVRRLLVLVSLYPSTDVDRLPRLPTTR